MRSRALPRPRQGHEYRGLKAATWDLFGGDTSQGRDRGFYLKVIRASGQPALDVGCGTGRLLLDYLAGGIDADGVDSSPEMLSICRHKAESQGLCPRLFQQTMECLRLPRTYRTIVVPSSSFQLLVEPDDAAEAMRCFFHHLDPGGTLVMPFVVLRHGTEGDIMGDWKISMEKWRPEDGALVRLWSRMSYDLAEQLEHAAYRYEVRRDGKLIATESYSRSPATRWYTRDQAVRLYQAAGFRDVRAVRAFTRQTAAADDRLFCVTGTRA